MIAIKLIGGLGNQMFQYALGRYLADRHQTALLLDLVNYETDPIRAYELRHFNINPGVITPREADKFTFRPEKPVSKAIRAIRQTLRPRHVVHEPHYWFWPAVAEVRDDSYLVGYWQSWKYFAPVEAAIRADFALDLVLDPKGAALQRAIGSVNAVCLHVRRTDYITDKNANALMGVCGMDYYEKAIALVADKVAKPYFFVFSDDTAWCEQHLAGALAPFPHTLVGKEYPEGPGIAHFQLMTRCKSFIIANSTFSWWAAWLGTHPGKTVLTPQRPYASPLMEARDFYPQDWLQI